jgi:hypothetical protein
MARPRIRYAQDSNSIVLTYHLPGGWFAPLAVAWSMAGGLAVGIGVAVVLAVVGATAISFGQALMAGTVIVAITLYVLGSRWAQRVRFLRVTFDYAQNALAVWRAYAGQRPAWFAFEDVAGFRLVARSAGWRAGCALVMDVYDAEPEILVALGRRADDEGTALPHLVARLEAQLTLRLEPDEPVYAAPPVPARRWPHEDISGAPEHDVYHYQQSSE